MAYVGLFRKAGHQLSATGALFIDRNNQNWNTQSYLSIRVCNWLTLKHKDHCSCIPEPAQTLLMEFISNTSNLQLISLLHCDKHALLFYFFSKYFYLNPQFFYPKHYYNTGSLFMYSFAYFCNILYFCSLVKELRFPTFLFSFTSL